MWKIHRECMLDTLFYPEILYLYRISGYLRSTGETRSRELPREILIFSVWVWIVVSRVNRSEIWNFYNFNFSGWSRRPVRSLSGPRQVSLGRKDFELVRQLRTPGTDATPFRYFRLRDRPTFAFSGTPLRNLTFFASPARIDIPRKLDLTNLRSQISARETPRTVLCTYIRIIFKVYGWNPWCIKHDCAQKSTSTFASIFHLYLLVSIYIHSMSIYHSIP